MPTPTASLADLATVARACVQTMQRNAATAADDTLLDFQRDLAAIARLIDLGASAVAAEIDHRSRRELGYNGLAARHGARTPEALVQRVTGVSAPAARRLVRVGELISTAAPEHPWLRPVLAAVSSGALSAEALEVIRVGLGSPTAAVSVDALTRAADELAGYATALTLEQLASRAREARDELDAAGVALREEQRRDRRFLRLVPQSDGMTRVSGLLDPESAAIVVTAIDAATSPRRGGPRFVDPKSADAAQKLLDDPRTIEQIALDALVELVDVAVRSDTLPGRRADVRVLVTQRDLDRRARDRRDGAARSQGVAQLEGQSAAVSLGTVERHACDGGLLPILFDDEGRTLNLGRSQRLHSARQRIAIAARDGGCLAPGCDRPPRWCEVHHIREFSRGGRTDLDQGVLLCRHHHLLVHNNGWRVDLRAGRYWFIPPPDVESRQTPIPLPSKSAAVRRMLHAV